jgi:Protein of unknown function (DUF1244)
MIAMDSAIESQSISAISAPFLDNGNGNSLVLDADILLQLQAAAFRSLCRHLQERSDLVSNMDLMSVSGFCRNCLAKVCCSCCEWISGRGAKVDHRELRGQGCLGVLNSGLFVFRCSCSLTDCFLFSPYSGWFSKRDKW